MSELFVRRYRGADHDEVVALWRKVFGEGSPWNDPDYVIARKTVVQADLFLVGELGGAVVATVLAGYDGVRGWIYSLAVSAEHRRRGFGASMVHAAESALVDRGCPKINLQVRGGNEQVVGFYRRLGYEVEDRVSMGRPVRPRRV